MLCVLPYAQMAHPTAKITITNFFGALHYFLTSIILAPFLAQFMGDSAVGLVFSAAALLSLSGFLLLPWIIRRVSLKRFAQILSIVQFGILIAILQSPSLPILITLVIFLAALPALISYTFDIFLEQMTKDEGTTGNIRGFFIGVSNIALVISPLAIGYILGDTNEYFKIFALAAATLLPFVLLLTALIPSSNHKEVETPSFKGSLKCLLQSKDVLLGASAHFILILFFSWVIIYIPLYLHNSLGIPWSELGWVFSIMLLPYVLLEYPIGIVADKWFGEREIMMGGFAVMGISMALISFIATSAVTLFLVSVLILTRVGGSMVEITTETYFFKHVDGDDLNSIGLFRMLRPLGALFGPLIGSFALLFVSLQSIFIILGGLCLIGIPLAFFIKDTR